jgi:predicted sulfurtransferase
MACCSNFEYAKLGEQGQEEFEQTVMQRPNADSIYYDDFLQFQEKLQKRIVSLRNKRNLVQEDMAEYELSVRQYQRMEQDPTAIVSLWQLFKIAKAHNLDIDELLRLD